MGFFDIGQGGTQTLYETSKWCASRKSLGIADIDSHLIYFYLLFFLLLV